MDDDPTGRFIKMDYKCEQKTILHAKYVLLHMLVSCTFFEFGIFIMSLCDFLV